MLATPNIDLAEAVKAYKGFSGLARRLGLSLSTVHGWHQRGSVPEWRRKQIISVAKRDGYGDVVLAKAKKARGKPRARG